ncbi:MULTISPECIES: ATP-dependent endonuclease [Enterobacter]|uniref:AAA family ATPase n=1 Tax=Enterobacter ludwigii TaxID=299767 RepID=A0AAX3LEN3_9ENTR|nr:MULTISPECIES: AAA family ATPase [Enterobacter]ELK6309174.1 AAA family ATPase [Enterobacter ludwigii]ELK6312665.1 AAA family ATPase [Enterobacter ludwigii]ELN9423419.1 AAA family ATPase [Enterobacter ludwigii]ELP5693088.1 AAA family ATPase [Enterobacter ludwigii]EMD2742960.1 AAA family ATPase [Enterobacter ludwigii]
MRLHTLKINGFKRIHNSQVNFGDTTFLIGSNNAGKSSVLKAIEWLLSDKKRMATDCYCSEIDTETGENKVTCKDVILEAEFRNIPDEAKNWRGFKGRVFTYDPLDTGETGNSIFYRKSYSLGEDVVIELKSLKRDLKKEFENLKKPSDYIDAGIKPEIINELFPALDKNISTGDKSKLELIDDIWDITKEEVWDKNPGGIGGVVLSKLPSFLLIPAESGVTEIEDKTGVLQKTLNELFKDVRGSSANYKRAQECLNELAKELNPSDEESEFGIMMGELNKVLCCVFPESKIYASADLSNPDTALSPSFSIEMSSNIRTAVSNQGTGMVRAAVFGLLRFRQAWLKKRGEDERSLIIGFEEPEIYLHPSAANQMRDIIYELSGLSSQIIATTHSPYLIDLSRKPRQILNRFHYDSNHTSINPFSVTEKYKQLSEDDKSYVKMIMKLDDHMSRIFFTKKVIVVEGDTEEIIFKEALRRVPASARNKILTNTELVKARGKAAIIGLIKYLTALDVDFIVIHDRDKGVKGAELFNPHILEAAGNPEKVIVVEECIEDILGYPVPTSEKPFNAYKETLKWGSEFDEIPVKLKAIMQKVYHSWL